MENKKGVDWERCRTQKYGKLERKDNNDRNDNKTKKLRPTFFHVLVACPTEKKKKKAHTHIKKKAHCYEKKKKDEGTRMSPEKTRDYKAGREKEETWGKKRSRENRKTNTRKIKMK